MRAETGSTYAEESPNYRGFPAARVAALAIIYKTLFCCVY